MLKILTSAVLILSILLFPPATLAFVSQDALPGDSLYPVKRKLEDAVLLFASITPSTKAWFAVAYSGRRYKETASLINKGKNSDAILTVKELVFQTDIAAEEIKKIGNSNQRASLASNLKQTIEGYSKGLEESKKQVGIQVALAKDNNLTDGEETFDEIDNAASPSPSSSAKVTASPRASPTLKATNTPSPTPATTGGGTQSDAQDLQDAIDDARADLEGIQDDLDQIGDLPNPEDVSSDSSLIDSLLIDLGNIDINGLDSTLNSTLNKYNSLFL